MDEALKFLLQILKVYNRLLKKCLQITIVYSKNVYKLQSSTQTCLPNTNIYSTQKKFSIHDDIYTQNMPIIAAECL